MSDIENRNLLHNMSAPPKTVVTYAGLAGLAAQTGADDSVADNLDFKDPQIFGTPVRFELPVGLAERSSPSDVLRNLGEEVEIDPLRRLIELIEVRAYELPIPDGCVVIPAASEHRVLWPDVLSTLAILSKSSDSIWLRSKTPTLNAALLRRRVTLLIPPSFTNRLPEICK